MIATLSAPQVHAAPVPRLRPAVPAGIRPVRRAAVSSVSVTTFVLWLGCAAIAAAGALLPYARPVAAKATPPVVQAERIQVELAPQVSPRIPAAVIETSAPPPPAELFAPAPTPAPIAVAELTEAVAFAVPVEGNVRVVDLAQAGHRGRSTVPATSAAASPSPQTLVFGQGEGRQPAPVYPARASRMGQEGVVTVRFTVDASGHIVAAEASEPCPWPLLNEAAVRTVREQWRFRAGSLRVYDVAIRFQLRK